MNLTVAFDWKVAVALGATIVAFYLVKKMDTATVATVSTTLADTCRELADTQKSSR